MTGAIGKTTAGKPLSSAAAREAWLEDRYFKYRGCAPDADNPLRMAGNPDLPVGAHHAPDAWESESQRERREREAAVTEVCLDCPVMVLCDAYASSVTPEGKLAEPDGVWGGRTGLERHKALIRSRSAAPPAPDRRFHTAQKMAVLRAFAVCWDPYEVAADADRIVRELEGATSAGMDLRTANWQRSNLTTLLGLPPTASRAQFLAAAGARGLLEGVAVVADDGSVPAVPPPTRMPDRAAPAAGPVAEVCQAAPVPLALASPPAPAAVPVGPYEPVRVPAPRRDRFTDIVGQLALWEAELELADVHPLFPAAPLEAAA